MSASKTGAKGVSKVGRIRRCYAGGASLAFAAALAMPAAAWAQTTEAEQAPPAEVEATGDGRIVDIVVTARRVEERLQDIPASVSAITGDEVARMDSLADIQSLVSGVTFQTVGPIPVVGIRGFGNRSIAGNPSNSAVGIFQDGVFVTPVLSTVINRTDTARVEVAKGPQSTLYGRSSFTGAFNIVTADPADEFSGYVDAGYGLSSVDGEVLYRIQGAVSIPLTDTLSVRLYGLHEKRDGFTLDKLTGNRAGGYDRQIGRITLLWQPSDMVTARLSGSIFRDDIPFPFVTAGRIRAPLGQNIIFANPFNPASSAALSFGDSVFDAKYAFDQSNKIKGEEVTLDLRFETPFGELASLSNYQNSTLDPFFTLDATRLAWATGSSPYDEERYSQELRVANKNGPLSYLAGLYFLNSKVHQGGGKFFDVTKPFASFGPGSIQFDDPFPLLPPPPLSAILQPSFTETNAYAAFGQLGYDITDALNLTVGLRYGQDEIKGTAGTGLVTRTGVVIPATPITYRRAVFDAVTGSANLSYKIAPDVIAYASFARGNSPGGLNTGAFARVNFEEQEVDAYELGLKSRLFDRRLQLNLALFENQYSGLQLTQNVLINNQLVGFVSNAAKARGRGFDMDALAVVSDNIRLGLQYTYVDSKITSFFVPPPPAIQVDFTGVPLVRSPKHSLNASATFSQDIGPGKFDLTATQSYTSSYTNDYQGVPAGTAFPGIPGVLAPGVTATQVLGLFRTKGYSLTDLNASYSWDAWEFNASVRNLFDKEYISTVLAFDLVTVPLELPGRPRTVEFSVRYNF